MHYAPMVVSKTLVSWWIDAFWFLCIRSDAEFLLLFAQAVQLIKLDLDRLDKISKLCSGPKKIALEYFARANEIRFFPELDALQHWASLDLLDEDNWAYAKPLIQVINYSNISEGTVFKIGFSNMKDGKGGSFEPVVSPGNYLGDWYADMFSIGVGMRLFQQGEEDEASK